MSRKYVNIIMNRIQTKVGLNERVIAINQSSNKFIVETMTYIPSVPFSSIEIKDIKPCDVIINESKYLSRDIGSIFLWGTNVSHEVTPIEMGIRNSLIFFVSEKHIKPRKTII